MKRRLCIGGVVALALWTGKDGFGMAEQEQEFDPASLKPFTAGAMYLGKHATGLYPERSNDIPKAHQQAGVRVAAAIRPLDAAGKPDDKDGRIIGLVLGHSNCEMYFAALQQHLQQHAAKLNPRFELLNAAVGGQQLAEIHQLKGRVWDRAAALLARPGYSPQQVQVVFLHTTYHGAGNAQKRPPGAFPETMQRMRKDTEEVLEHCVKTWPNLRIAYLTCDGFRHYTGFEPHVWQEAFAFKWLIEGQIRGEEGTAFEDRDGKVRRLPWLQWGPYIWDNTWDLSYFTDGVHPAAKACDIFVAGYATLLGNDPVARPWLMREPAASGPTTGTAPAGQ